MTGRIYGVWRAFHLHAGRWRRQRRQMAPKSDAGLRPSMLASLPTRSRSPWEAAAVAAISQAAATEEMTSLNTLPTLWVGSAVRADEVIAQNAIDLVSHRCRVAPTWTKRRGVDVSSAPSRCARSPPRSREGGAEQLVSLSAFTPRATLNPETKAS